MQSSIDSKIRKSFTGKEFDDDGASGDDDNGMNLYYFGKRYYDPEIIRWISTDYVKQYWNTYSYCGGNPITTVDKDGSVGEATAVGTAVCPGVGTAVGITIEVIIVTYTIYNVVQEIEDMQKEAQRGNLSLPPGKGGGLIIIYSLAELARMALEFLESLKSEEEENENLDEDPEPDPPDPEPDPPDPEPDPPDPEPDPPDPEPDPPDPEPDPPDPEPDPPDPED